MIENLDQDVMSRKQLLDLNEYCNSGLKSIFLNCIHDKITYNTDIKMRENMATFTFKAHGYF